MKGKPALAALGGVGAAFVAGFCCIGAPLAAAGMVGAAGVAVAVEPLRPVFLLLTAGLLLLAFRLARKRSRGHAQGTSMASDCPGQTCAVSDAARHPRLLWVATSLALALATLPLWIGLVR